MKYYVYKVVARQGDYKGQVVYVGKGKGNRLNHCLSGCSSSKELNRYYFLNGEDESMDVSIVSYFKTDREALEYEVEMIKELRPIFNKLMIVKPLHDARDFWKSFRKVLYKNGRKSGTRLFNKTIEQIKAFVDFYTLTELQKGCKVSRAISKNSPNENTYIFTNSLMKRTVRPFLYEIFLCSEIVKGEMIVTIDLNKINSYINSQSGC